MSFYLWRSKKTLLKKLSFLTPFHTPILVSLSEEPPMADMDDAKRIHQLNGALYRALMEKKPKDVLGCFKSLPEDEGPLHKITIHKDTVLHMACYSKQRDLALELLQLLPPSVNQWLANTKKDVDNTNPPRGSHLQRHDWRCHWNIEQSSGVAYCS